MSDDELEKLAQEMQNMGSSEAARKRGMGAAMAAFTSEFAAENLAQEKTASENISNETQGLANAARPIGESTSEGFVRTLGRHAVSAFDKVFNISPRATMMGGSCMAAFIAAFVVYQAVPYDSYPVPAVKAPEIVATDNAAEAQERIEPLAVEPAADAPAAEPKPAKDKIVGEAPTAQGNTYSSVEELLDKVRSDAARGPDESDELYARAKAKFDNAKTAGAKEKALSEYRAELQQRQNLLLSTSSELSSINNESAPVPAPPATSAPLAELAPAPVLAPTPPASKAQGGINPIDSILDHVRQPTTRPPHILQNKKAETTASERRAALQQKNTIPTFSSQSAFVVNRSHTPINLGNQQPAFSAGSATPTVPSTASSAPLPKTVRGLTVEEVPSVYETVEETVVNQEASTEFVTVPATYETYTDTIAVQEASTELVTIPPQYEWVEGDVEGHEVAYDIKPAEYETVKETVVVQEASTELVTIPATFETVKETVVIQEEYVASDGSIVPAKIGQISRRVVKTPASTQELVVPAVTKVETRRVVKTPAATIERIIPYEKRDGKTRVVVTPGSVKERIIPVVTKEVTRRRIKTPAMTVERTIPTLPRTVQRQALVTPPKYILRDDDGNVVREFKNRDAFEIYKANLPTLVEEAPVSTFSVDVDTASYSFLRSSLNRGQLPPSSAIRLEEMINYFPYDYEAPKSADEPFKANVSVTPTPWNADTKLMHIGIKGYVPPKEERPRSNLVFLIDTSGSMRNAKKLPLLINSFKLLLNTLDKDDTVSIVTYAGSVGTVLEPTAASEKRKIKEALTRLSAGGGTAGAAGLELAYQNAEESFDEDAINRVILATDGDFNIGFSSPDEMKDYISKKRDTGIFLSVLGFGHGNYNDHLMQSLAQNGNGVAAYIDTLSEAHKVLADEAGSALIPIAKDVKIQVEFNPETISEYRLLGYETRALKRQDFNNDKVDAGEINSGHTVTAIYELTPVGSPAISVDPLRYAEERLKIKGTGSDELAFVKIRHKLPNSDSSTLQTFPVGPRQTRKLNRASDDMRFAAAVAAVGQKLRGDTQLEDFSYEAAIKLASGAKGDDENGYRAEFIQLIRLAEGLEE